MSTLQVANIQFESTGTNRIDFPTGGNTINFRSTNLSFNATSILINGISFTNGVPTYSANIGNGTANSFTITHNLASATVISAVRENSSGYYVYPDIKYVNTNSITIEFSIAPTTNQYFVIVK